MAELLIGITSTLGSKCDIVVQSLKSELENYKYDVVIISIKSDIIQKIHSEIKDLSEVEKRKKYIEYGNSLRKEYGDRKILAILALGLIKRERKKHDENKNIAFIIKSLKNNEEINIFRKIYGNCFYLIGVTSSLQLRKDNLTRLDISEIEADELISIDNNEDAFHKSDYFIEIKSQNSSCLPQVERFLKLIFGYPYLTPTFDEHAMFIAFMSSLRSADLSRQVGAAIGINNQIIAMGANDCPQFGGGLYWPIHNGEGKIEDVDGGRDYTLGYDYNKEQLRILEEDIAKKLSIKGEDVEKLKNSNLKNIIDYCRPVHAEMEALLSCARSNISCKDATMYVTTFPCHNCAKHILAAGIKKVFFIEPYPKSKTLEMYSNEITILETEQNNKCLFKLFEGVGPNRYIEFFSMNTMYAKKKRKDDEGKTINWKKTSAKQINYAYPIGYREAEIAAIELNRIDPKRKNIDELWDKIIDKDAVGAK